MKNNFLCILGIYAHGTLLCFIHIILKKIAKDIDAILQFTRCSQSNSKKCDVENQSWKYNSPWLRQSETDVLGH
jgi:hypothetical protein